MSENDEDRARHTICMASSFRISTLSFLFFILFFVRNERGREEGGSSIYSGIHYRNILLRFIQHKYEYTRRDHTRWIICTYIITRDTAPCSERNKGGIIIRYFYCFKTDAHWPKTVPFNGAEPLSVHPLETSGLAVFTYLFVSKCSIVRTSSRIRTYNFCRWCDSWRMVRYEYYRAREINRKPQTRFNNRDITNMVVEMVICGYSSVRRVWACGIPGAYGLCAPIVIYLITC